MYHNPEAVKTYCIAKAGFIFSMTNQHQITQEGYNKLEEELKHLKDEKRPKAVERLKRAREMGDLSENSEYSAAKEELSFLDTRIIEIEEILRSATIITNGIHKDVVDLGDSVVVSVNGSSENYTIVGEHEADVATNKLSQSSPIGSALLGHKKGDVVEVMTPSGKVEYKIISVK